MADHNSTTLPLPAREPRPLVIPYVLTPAELDGLLRIGESLANISDRLSAMMGRNGGPLAGEMRAFVEEVLVTLDRLDGDPDLEEGGDLEPSLAGSHTDLEAEGEHDEDGGDAEPNLAGSHTDREQDLSDEELDDPLEANSQPVRLDVALAREEAAHG